MLNLNGSDAVFPQCNMGFVTTPQSEARRPCGRGGKRCITGRAEDAARTGMAPTGPTGQPGPVG